MLNKSLILLKSHLIYKNKFKNLFNFNIKRKDLDQKYKIQDYSNS